MLSYVCELWRVCVVVCVCVCVALSQTTYATHVSGLFSVGISADSSPSPQYKYRCGRPKALLTAVNGAAWKHCFKK